MTEGPLAGLRVVVTRPRDQATPLVDALEAQGGSAVCVPVIEIIDPADEGDALDRAIESLTKADWLVVTSPNGATRVAAAATHLECRVAAIGPGTRARAEAAGLGVDLVPDRSIAEGLVEAFPDPPPGGGRVVLARAEAARQILPDALRARGWDVLDVVAYRTIAVPVDSVSAAACRGADIVAFTSSSTVEHLCAAVGLQGLPPIVAAIGPATSSTASALGVPVHVEAPAHTISGLVDAIVEFLADTPIIHAENPTSPDAQWCLEQYLADIDERFDSDPLGGAPSDGGFFVARLDGRPVGCGCFEKVTADVAAINRMWLDPSVRGRGLGRRMLERLIDAARSLGFHRVQLDTNEAQTEAIALYRSAGFVEVAPFNDEPHAHYWFALDLS